MTADPGTEIRPYSKHKIMINKGSMSVTVRRVSTKEEKPYFSRIIDDTAPGIDINVILSALRMLFRGDMFKITIETYGE